MIKRQWSSVLFIVAFVISLAHSSIPHTHPERVEDHHSHNHDHSKFNDHNDHHKGKNSHTHDESDHQSEDKLPVFSHFSNADYIGNTALKFDAKEKYVIQFLQPALNLIEVPEEFQKTILFPRARDLPSNRYRSTQSLRAPPFFS